MQKKWKAFGKKIDTKTDDFNAVLRTIKKFLTEPYKAAVADIKYTKIWLANNNSWIQAVSYTHLKTAQFVVIRGK